MGAQAIPADLIGSVEAAERCGVERRTAIRWFSQGRLPAYKIAGRWRVSLADLNQFVASSRYSPPATG